MQTTLETSVPALRKVADHSLAPARDLRSPTAIRSRPVVIWLVMGLCLIPMLWPVFSVLQEVAPLSAEISAEIAESEAMMQTLADAAGFSVASTGTDFMLYLLTITSIAVLAWRFSLRYRRHHQN